MARSRRSTEGYKSLQGLTKAVVVLEGAAIVAFIGTSFLGSKLGAAGILAGLIGVPVLGFIVFLVWVYRLHHNQRVLSRTTEVAPWKAVAVYFVPIVNLFTPYKHMLHAWRQSGLVVDERADPPVVLWWWLLFVVRSFSSTIVRFATGENFFELVYSSQGALLGWSLVIGFKARFTVQLVRAFTVRQELLIRR